MLKITKKKAQEEMIGFAMIIIIVAVIVLILLGLALNKPKTSTGVESYEIESFIVAGLQHTSDCSVNRGVSYAPIEDLIMECDNEQFCEDGRLACEALEATWEDILGDSWKAGEDVPVKGYLLNVTSDSRGLVSFDEGNITSNYKGSAYPLSRRGSDYSIELKVYY